MTKDELRHTYNQSIDESTRVETSLLCFRVDYTVSPWRGVGHCEAVCRGVEGPTIRQRDPVRGPRMGD